MLMGGNPSKLHVGLVIPEVPNFKTAMPAHFFSCSCYVLTESNGESGVSQEVPDADEWAE
jgi:hypothetical protein